MSEPLTTMKPPTDFPTFRYHPDPIATGAVKESEERCTVCGEHRGYIYEGSIYSADRASDDARVCPWCIADGSVSEKYGGSLNGGVENSADPVSRAVRDEVEKRTPGYESWQDDEWLTHCNDACEFHGDATAEEIRTISEEVLQEWIDRYNMSRESWFEMTDGYEPPGNPAFYRFQCRHCAKTVIGFDMT